MEEKKITIVSKIFQTIMWVIIFPFGLLAYLPAKALWNDDDITFKEYITDYFKHFKTIWSD